MRPHRPQPTRLPHPWDSPGKNIGVGCHFLLQCMEVKSESEVAQSCPTLSDLMDCSPPGSSVHGIFQARVLEWGAIVFSDVGHSGPYSWVLSLTWNPRKTFGSLPDQIFILQGSLAALQRINKWGKVGGDGGPVDMERAIVIQGGNGSGSYKIKVRLRELDRRSAWRLVIGFIGGVREKGSYGPRPGFCLHRWVVVLSHWDRELWEEDTA